MVTSAVRVSRELPPAKTCRLPPAQPAAPIVESPRLMKCGISRPDPIFTGGYGGAGLAAFITNANGIDRGCHKMIGPFMHCRLSIGSPFPFGARLGLSLDVSDDGTWVFSFGPPGFGEGAGASAAGYSTNTWALSSY